MIKFHHHSTFIDSILSKRGFLFGGTTTITVANYIWFFNFFFKWFSKYFPIIFNFHVFLYYFFCVNFSHEIPEKHRLFFILELGANELQHTIKETIKYYKNMQNVKDFQLSIRNIMDEVLKAVEDMHKCEPLMMITMKQFRKNLENSKKKKFNSRISMVNGFLKCPDLFGTWKIRKKYNSSNFKRRFANAPFNAKCQQTISGKRAFFN